MTASNPAIGIDLGTTYSCVGIVTNYQGGDPRASIKIREDNGRRAIPSVVYYDPDEPNPIVGDTAQAKMFAGTGQVAFDSKRFIGRSYADPVVQDEKKRNESAFKIVDKDGYPNYALATTGGGEKLVAPEEVSAEVLKTLKEMAMKGYNCQDITQAVITCPAYFTDAQTRQTEEAARRAGFKQVWLLKEPIAAALPYGLELPPDQQKTVLVFDFGGGTLDISIVRMENNNYTVLAVSGNSHLGGSDLDNRLVKFVVDKIRTEEGVDISSKQSVMKRLRSVCEETKKKLSKQKKWDIELTYNDGDHIVTILRDDFERINMDLFGEAMNIVDKAFDATKFTCGHKLYYHEIDEVLLVGGSSRIPKVQDMLSKKLGRHLNEMIPPEEAVAYGATIWAGVKTGVFATIQLKDIVTMSVGVQCHGNRVSKILPQGTPVSQTNKQTFTTVHDNQTEVRIRVRQGESTEANKNTFIGSFLLKGITSGM